eukprot:CAMPEP_0117541754 /NCGR_PEP_ID=MMETSP0784-20121206/44180_1 /TAXON_ID=39447 /ORGANISM="" /LENGTH=164 /DNA_ID=CAMNT_0005338455 /DNA_START=696 /DNA_END=1188 /DNA_ORIENTATION=+
MRGSAPTKNPAFIEPLRVIEEVQLLETVCGALEGAVVRLEARGKIDVGALAEVVGKQCRACPRGSEQNKLRSEFAIYAKVLRNTATMQVASLATLMEVLRCSITTMALFMVRTVLRHTTCMSAAVAMRMDPLTMRVDAGHQRAQHCGGRDASAEIHRRSTESRA